MEKKPVGGCLLFFGVVFLILAILPLSEKTISVPYTERVPYQEQVQYTEQVPYTVTERTKWDVTWYILTGAGQWGPPIGKEVWDYGTFDWNWGSGIVYGGYSDYVGFVAKATVYASSGRLVTFYLGSDDGATLYIDNTLVIDRWGSNRYGVTSATFNLSPGKHTLEIDYYEWTGDARVSFNVDDRSILSWQETEYRQETRYRTETRYREETRYRQETTRESQPWLLIPAIPLLVLGTIFLATSRSRLQVSFGKPKR
jgi:hypothetical protein